MKKIILSLDGGGIRGIVTASVLNYLEEKIQEITKDDRIHLADLVDFVGGTSTGSIIGGLMIIPENESSTKPKFYMSEIVDLYFGLGEQVFKPNLWRNIKTLWGLIGPKYDVKNLELPLLQEMGFTKLKQLTKPCMFPAYDINKAKVVFYTNKDQGQKYAEYYIKDVVRGSTSIPPYFKPAFFKYGVDENTLIDGGVFANNPTLSSMIEASKTFDVKPKDMLIISLGTGKINRKTYPINKVKNWGTINWILPLIDILLESHAEVTDYQMQKIFSNPKNYIRINPPIILGNSSAVDSSKENIINLSVDAETYIMKNRGFLDNLAKEIIKINNLVI